VQGAQSDGRVQDGRFGVRYAGDEGGPEIGGEETGEVAGCSGGEEGEPAALVVGQGWEEGGRRRDGGELGA
jgi:hypothetical protein